MFEAVATELPRILACNGSILLGGQKPPNNDDPTARNEGNAAHWLVVHCFISGVDTLSLVGKKAPNGVTITHAIAASCVDYLDHMRARAGQWHGVEQSVTLQAENWCVTCRPDFYSFDGATLEIDDFKHGFRIVEPRENWTMIAYALAITQAGGWPRPQNTILRIHQPRVPHPSGTVREHRYSAEELQNRYEYIDRVLTNPNDTLNTGPHCDKCPNVTVCPAARMAGFNAVDLSLTAHSENMPDDKIGQELEILTDAEKRLKARKKQLSDLAIYRIKQGAVVPNFALERSYSNNVFKDDFSPEFLSGMLGVNVVKQDVITPAQAVKAGAPEPLVKMFSTRKETGLKLTRVNANELAQRMFGKKG